MESCGRINRPQGKRLNMKKNIKTTMTLELTKSEFEVIRFFLDAIDDYANDIDDSDATINDIYYYVNHGDIERLKNAYNLDIKITD